MTIRVNDLVHLRGRRGYYRICAIDTAHQMMDVVPVAGMEGGPPIGPIRTVRFERLLDIAARDGKRVRE